MIDCNFRNEPHVMTYRHVMTSNYMTYDIKFSHVVAALVPIVEAWLWNSGVRKWYVRNRPGIFVTRLFHLAKRCVWSGHETSCSQKAKRFFDLEMSWMADRQTSNLLATEIVLVYSTAVLPQCTHTNDTRNNGCIGWKVALSRQTVSTKFRVE